MPQTMEVPLELLDPACRRGEIFGLCLDQHDCGNFVALAGESLGDFEGQMTPETEPAR